MVFTVQKALPLLNDGASVVLNASNCGSRAAAGNGVYAAIKTAIRSFARTWAVAVLFLAADLSSFVTGAEIVVDGDRNTV